MISFREKLITRCTEQAKSLNRKLNSMEIVETAVKLHEEIANPKPTSRGTNIPPSAEDVTRYSKEIDYPMDGKMWCDHYAAKGWLISGKSKMKDWKAACRNWKASGWGQETKIALAKPVIFKAPSPYIEPAGWRYRFPDSIHIKTPWNLLDKPTQKVITQQMA